MFSNFSDFKIACLVGCLLHLLWEIMKYKKANQIPTIKDTFLKYYNSEFFNFIFSLVSSYLMYIIVNNIHINLHPNLKDMYITNIGSFKLPFGIPLIGIYALAGISGSVIVTLVINFINNESVTNFINKIMGNGKQQ